MLPYVTLFGHTLSTYSVLAILGFLAGLLLVVLASPRFGLNRDDSVYLYVFSFAGVLVGAKLLSLLPLLPQMAADLPMLWTGEWERFVRTYLTSGMVYYGGLAGAVVGAWLTARYFSLRLSDFFPVLVPAMPLAWWAASAPAAATAWRLRSPGGSPSPTLWPVPMGYPCCRYSCGRAGRSW